MIYCIFVISIIIIALAIASLFRQHINTSLPVAVLLLIFILYLLGHLGLLYLGKYMLIGLAFISLAFLILIHKREKINIKNQLIAPGMIIFIILAIINYFINYDRSMLFYDEFSIWGLAVKNMHLYDDFGHSPLSTVTARHYPPISSLFLYLLSSLDCCFKERNLYFAFNIFQVSLLLPFLRVFNPKALKESILPAIVVLMIPVILYYNNYYSIYPDILVGILFAYIIYNYYTSIEINSFTSINLFLAFVALTLVKRIGIYFSFLAIMIIIGDIIFAKRSKEIKKYYQLIFLISAIIISYVSWELHVTMVANHGITNTELISNTVVSTFEASDINIVDSDNVEHTFSVPDYWLVTIKEFIKNIIPYLYLSAYFMMICFLVYRYLPSKIPIQPKSLLTYAVGIVVGFFIYAFIMLITYLTHFSAFEASKVASFSRYMHSYIAGVSLSLSYFLLMIDQSIIKDKKVISAFMVALIAISLILPIGISSTGTGHAAYLNLLGDLQETKDFVNFMDIEKDNIYFISQATHDINHQIFKFYVTPIKSTNSEGWTISTTEEESGNYYIIDESRWADLLLNHYTYLYIYKADNVLIEQYGKYFSNPADIIDMSLFKIKLVNGIVLLVSVDKKTGE